MTASLNMIRGRSNIVTLTNNSGGALIAGDVCVQDTSADEKVTTTTSAASVLKVFVAAESIASGAAGRFYESGYCPLVNVNASVTRGRFLLTHTVAKQAAESATYASGAFGKILKSGTTPSAIIYSATAQIGSSGVARSGSTTDGHLAVWNGSSADSIKDGGIAPAASLVFIGEQTPTGTTATFSSIPGSYKALLINWVARTDKAGSGFETGDLNFNSDSTAANYREISVDANGSAIASSAADDAQVFLFTGATATAGLAAYGSVEIPFYAETTFQKVAYIQSNTRYGDSTQNIRNKAIFWENTAAITRIDIITSSASNFISGSIFRMYGIV